MSLFFLTFHSRCTSMCSDQDNESSCFSMGTGIFDFVFFYIRYIEKYMYAYKKIKNAAIAKKKYMDLIKTKILQKYTVQWSIVIPTKKQQISHSVIYLPVFKQQQQTLQAPVYLLTFCLIK